MVAAVENAEQGPKIEEKQPEPTKAVPVLEQVEALLVEFQKTPRVGSLAYQPGAAKALAKRIVEIVNAQADGTGQQ